MPNVIRFKTRAELDAETNLRRFIELCRDQLTVFGVDLAFDDNVWDISDFMHLKGKPGRRRMVFSIAPTGRYGQVVAFQEPYLSFAKAYMRHQFAYRGQWFYESGIKTLRVLYAAMTEQGGTPNPTEITLETLNRSVQMLGGLGQHRAFHIANELQKLAAFLVANHLVTVPLEWKSPWSSYGGVPYAARVGKEFDELRAKMLLARSARSPCTHLSQCLRAKRRPGFFRYGNPMCRAKSGQRGVPAADGL